MLLTLFEALFKSFELFYESLFDKLAELKLEDLGEMMNFLSDITGENIFPCIIFLSLIMNIGISNYLFV